MANSSNTKDKVPSTAEQARRSRIPCGYLRGLAWPTLALGEKHIVVRAYVSMCQWLVFALEAGAPYLVSD